ncbi:hypothetical protein GJAV_G00030330 [Gymnothorax javanicus]|nr:hypothetical protein GJAV_G00030330 [Gymnothorax javanicus]
MMKLPMKHLQSYKAPSPCQGELFSLTETQLLNCLKCLVCHPDFSCETCLQHNVTHLRNSRLLATLACPQTKQGGEESRKHLIQSYCYVKKTFSSV